MARWYRQGDEWVLKNGSVVVERRPARPGGVYQSVGGGPVVKYEPPADPAEQAALRARQAERANSRLRAEDRAAREAAAPAIPAGLSREEWALSLPGIFRPQQIGGVWYSAAGERLGTSLDGYMSAAWAAYRAGRWPQWWAQATRGGVATVAEATAGAVAAGTRAAEVAEAEANRAALDAWRAAGGAGGGDAVRPMVGPSVLPLAATALAAFFILRGGR